MKKKFIMLLISIIILILCVFIFFTDSIPSKYGKGIEFSNKEQLIAVFYLENVEGEYDYSLVNKYFSDKEIESFDVLEMGGDECYFIVPRYNMHITISSLTMAEDGVTKKSLYTTKEQPFFLKCNMSDIFSNSELSFQYAGQNYEYSPYISLKDGRVVIKDFVYLVGN